MAIDQNESARLDAGVGLSGLFSLAEALAKKGVIDAADLTEMKRVMVARAGRSDASDDARSGAESMLQGAFDVLISKIGE